jgi:hypothetical protein
MCTFSKLLKLSILVGCATLSQASLGQRRAPELVPPERIANWCTLPTHKASATLSVRNATVIQERESNDDFANAQIINLNHNNPSIVIHGTIPGFVMLDNDYFKVWLERGNILSIRMDSSIFPRVRGTIAPFVQLFGGDLQHTFIKANGNPFFSLTYPVASPLFKIEFDQTTNMSRYSESSIMEYIASEPSFVFIRATSSRPSESLNKNGYTLELSLHSAPMRSEPNGTVQKIFLDFDGHTLDAASLFGFGSANAVLSPMSAFLADWGLSSTDEDLVISAIIQQVGLKLNGTLAGQLDSAYELLNSRDHADPGSDPYTTRLVVGGTRSELGIPTLAIAESIDPGNFNFAETGVILLDVLSNTCTQAQVDDTTNPCTQSAHNLSLNNQVYDPLFSKINGIGRAVGNIACHELGHMLGCWHTEPTNTTRRLMDSGSVNVPLNLYEIGRDGIMGSSDDINSVFAVDRYFASQAESVNHILFIDSRELLDTRVAIGLTRAPETCPADINNDNVVDGSDLGLLLGAWGTDSLLLDLNNDGVVNRSDQGILLGQWGVCL